MSKSPVMKSNRGDFRLTDDICFKFVFSNKKNAIYMIETLFSIKVEHLDYINTNINGIQKGQKSVLFDSLVLVNKKYFIAFEMQNRRTKDLIERIGLTFVHLLSDKSPAGKQYIEPFVHIVWFMNFPWEQEEVYSPITLRDELAKPLLQQCDVQIVSLCQLEELLMRKNSEISELDALRLYMKYSHEEIHHKKMRELIKERKGLAHMEKSIEFMMQTPVRYSAYKAELRRRDNEERCMELEQECKRQQELRELEKQRHEEERKQELQERELEKQRYEEERKQELQERELEKQRYEKERKQELQERELEKQRHEEEHRKREQAEQILTLIRNGMEYEEANAFVLSNSNERESATT